LHTPLRTTSSQLQCIVRNILYNDFFKFNVHSTLQGYGLPVQQELTPMPYPAKKRNSPLRTTRSLLERLVRDIQHNDFFKFNVHRKLQGGLPVSDIYNS
jgi:hypothetical protein